MRPPIYHCLAGCVMCCSLAVGCSHNQQPATYSYSRPVAVTTLPATPLAAVPVKPVEPAPVVVKEVERPAPQVVQPVKYRVGEDEAAKRRSFADITAKPCYAHEPEYRWLSGELQFVHVRNAWRLRYASVDEEDRYGGSVTLTEVGSMTGYSNGQFVRVEGCMVNPDAKDPSPAYRVITMQPLAQP